ncbi:MAG: hypothetical protein CML20_00545 [Rheinheimera sp.]|uniref:hypothetical protein n=1 Tax=Arsukibacterium sp. UBA3155 TaxID=1946058 RepID=UPI000C8F4307|nr:hypothetical protein [Arsukibacterium sp. UBA3155]MAD73292.1 hypothetical protein [Rheinheimera sp.]|tara:strand:+ start:126001 stop:126447 length:447 start_codon:yes stop_codon:yes gene_type:complete
MLKKILFPVSLALSVFACNGVEIEKKLINNIVPSEICTEKAAFDGETTVIFSECEHYEFINQYTVTDAMSMADFSEFIANYKLGSEYETRLEQELLRHFDAMISPFDPDTKVSQHDNLILFQSKSHLALFQRNDNHWLLTKAVLPQAD